MWLRLCYSCVLSLYQDSLTRKSLVVLHVCIFSETWGFILESCWTVRTNFPMPAHGAAPRLEDDQLPITVDSQFAEVYCYNHGIDIRDISADVKRHLLAGLTPALLDSDEDSDSD
eukprot:m.63059 g.63059  ORF g.63059 m.63059 type:complete len:115 (+) comp13950_c0_seq7:547-891(+)